MNALETEYMKFNKGFTIIELLVVVALVTIIGLTSVPFLSRFFLQNAVTNTYDQLAGELRKAQTYAMEGKQNGPWGVYLNTSSNPYKIILYQGTDKGHIVKTFDTFIVNANVAITGFTDVNFAQVTGTTSAAVTITIKGNNTIKTITVSTQGVVNK